jgi:hypothetical protein
LRTSVVEERSGGKYHFLRSAGSRVGVDCLKVRAKLAQVDPKMSSIRAYRYSDENVHDVPCASELKFFLRPEIVPVNLDRRRFVGKHGQPV